MNSLATDHCRISATTAVATFLLLIVSALLAPAIAARTTTIKFPDKNLVRVDKWHSYLTVDNITVKFENENSSVNLYQIIGNEFMVYPCNIPIEADTAITSVTFNYAEGVIVTRGQQIVLEPGVAMTYDVSRNLKKVTMAVRKISTLSSIVVETAGDGDNQEQDPTPPTEPDPEPVKHTVTVSQPVEGGSVSVTDIYGVPVDLRSVADGTRLLVKATPDAGYELERITAGGVDITDTGEVTVKADIVIAATFKAVAKGVLALLPTVTGLPSDMSDALNVAVYRADGTPLSVSSAIEAGTDIRIVATLSDDRYLFSSMTVGGKRAVISIDGTTATIDRYELPSPVAEGSAAVYPIELAMAVDRRAVIVNYTLDAGDVTLSVTADYGGNTGNRVTSGDRVSTDTELIFRAVPEEGYEIEAMTVTAWAGTPVTASAADIDGDGACVLSLRTPRTTVVNLSVDYAVSVECSRKDDGPVYKQHTVTLAVAAGQEERGVVRFTDPAGAGHTVSTRSNVTFEAVPAQLPADSRPGPYYFAGWSNNASVDIEDASVGVQTYGGDKDVTFTAHFGRNCRILFTTSPDNGSMEITRHDSSVLAGGDCVTPGSTVTVTVAATESFYCVSAITVNGAEVFKYPDHPERVSQQLTVDEDMLIGCVIAIPSGIAHTCADSGMQPVGWFTLQGVALGMERPRRAGVYIAVYGDGRAARVAVTE